MNGKMQKIGHSIRLADVIETRKLVDFSYHLQIHDLGWISFYLKEENVWNNILELYRIIIIIIIIIIMIIIIIIIYNNNNNNNNYNNNTT